MSHPTIKTTVYLWYETYAGKGRWQYSYTPFPLPPSVRVSGEAPNHIQTLGQVSEWATNRFAWAALCFERPGLPAKGVSHD